MLTASSLDTLCTKVGLAGAAVVVRALQPPYVQLALRAAVPMGPASMIKVPIAVAAIAQLAEDVELLVAPHHMTSTDAPSPLQPGYRARLWEAIDLALARSDNVATNLLIDALDRHAANAYLAASGLSNTAIRRFLSGSLPRIPDTGALGENAHPAVDAATVFRLIAERRIASAERLEGVLAGQWWNDKLAAGLSEHDRFAHKTGDTDAWSHDGGILTTAQGRRWIIVLYTPYASSPTIDAAFAATMRSLRTLLS